MVETENLARNLPPGARDAADQAVWSPGQVNLEGVGGHSISTPVAEYTRPQAESFIPEI